MEAPRISWRTTATVIITLLHIQALISAKTKAVIAVEGETFYFRCEYGDDQKISAKYFSHDDGHVFRHPLIWTDKHDQWVREGRFSLYDNTTGAFFIVRVDKIETKDSGTYWCGVKNPTHADDINLIQLNVSRVTGSTITKDFTVDKLHLPLYLTAAMCVAAILSLCLFTLCLQLAVKHRGSAPHRNKETSSNSMTVMHGGRTDPDPSCSDPDNTELSDLLPPLPDQCSHLASELDLNLGSAVTFGNNDYVDVDVRGHICQYHHLDLGQLEEHVYDSLHENSEPLGVKEQFMVDTAKR